MTCLLNDESPNPDPCLYCGRHCGYQLRTVYEPEDSGNYVQKTGKYCSRCAREYAIAPWPFKVVR